jgi:riboflavin kinase/FMN adenylyltransferase
MRLFADWRSLPESARGASVALGNFDGVHRGHAQVLRAAAAARPEAKLAVLTFEPHPREVFRPDDPPFRLTLPKARAAALARLGVSILYELPFDEAFSAMGAEAFVREVLGEGVGARHLACGADYAFGHRKGGDVALLGRLAEGMGVGLSVVPAVVDAEGPISSTRIRRALQEGYPQRAAAALGREWALEGEVAHGDARGRTIGFPTANVALGRQLEPARGVYAVRVGLPDGRVVKGVANIGRRPTVNAGPESRLEAHLFDFAEDLYGQEISVGLVAFLRGERKFESFAALKDQIALDAAEARKILG